ELPGDLMQPPAVLDRLGRPLPHVAAEQWVGRIGDAQGVVRVDVERPVDPLRRVPLLVLALLVEGKEPGTAVVVLPGEARTPGHGYGVGSRGVDRSGVDVLAAHRRLLVTSGSCAYFATLSAPDGVRPGA